jgi:hypothetical protein
VPLAILTRPSFLWTIHNVVAVGEAHHDNYSSVLLPGEEFEGPVFPTNPTFSARPAFLGSRIFLLMHSFLTVITIFVTNLAS